MTIDSQILNSYRDIEQHKNSWLEILSNPDNNPHPFTDYWWIVLYAQYFLENCTLHILFSPDCKNPMIVPLHRRWRGYSYYGLIGEGIFDYNDIVGTVENGSKLIEFLTATDADVIKFSNIREDSPIIVLLESQSYSKKKFPYSITTEESVRAPYINLQGHTWESYYAGLSKNTKIDFRRKNKRLAALGTISFGYCEDITEIKEMLPSLFIQHDARRRNLGQKQSIYTDSKMKGFMTDIIDKLFLSAKLYLFYLKLDDQKIGYVVSFLYGNKLYYYIPTFDAKYSNCSPGTILLFYLIQHCFDHNIDELDFMIGEEGYKLKYSNGVRKTYNLFLHRKTLLGRIGYLHFLAQSFGRTMKNKAVQGHLKTIRRSLLKKYYSITHCERCE